MQEELMLAIQARMTRDFDRTGLLCRRVRSSSVPLSDYELAHLIILEIRILDKRFDVLVEERFEKFLQAARLMTPNEQQGSFLYSFEASGFMLHLKRYQEALKFSEAALKLSFDLNSYLAARMNSLVALEVLGVDISDFLEDYEKKMASGKVKTNIQRAIEFDSMKLRTWFRHKKIKKIIAYSGVAQAYHCWLSQLPQLRFPETARKKYFENSSGYDEYELNTLLGRFEDVKTNVPPVQLWSDRLYLWTWLALLKPKVVKLAHVLELLSQFEFEKNISRMSAEDRIMIYHCLSLLSLFATTPESSLARFFQALGPLDYEAHPFLKEEREKIVQIRKWLKGQKSELEHLPLKGSHLRYFPLHKDSPLHTLRKISKIPPNVRFIVDLRECCFEDRDVGTTVLSEYLVKAFELFLDSSRRSAVSVHEFVFYVFNFPVFDPLVHYRRVYNVLTRLKTLTSHAFNFKVRGHAIHFTIESDLFFVNREFKDFDSGKWRSILARVHGHSTKEPSSIVKSDTDLTAVFALKAQQTRSEIQQISGWTKSKTIRRLNGLLEAGVLKAKDRGKAKKYFLVDTK